MWRFGNIVTMVLAATVGGAVAGGGYTAVGTLIEGANSPDGMAPELAVVFGLISAVIGAVVGLVASVAAALVLVLLRHSSDARSRIWIATAAALVTGCAALTWLLHEIGSLKHGLVLIGVWGLLIVVLASLGLSIAERAQRARVRNSG
ncbi:hypothetical protein SAMN04489806_0950 [Paramicrobacterium humi]|uniref:Uncharacterized protein n=1 Tax=Paramicrobacterium humi TaxID=640635 RepID=A0A1H4JZW5_9MICO|nr:hypothetical protein [Microbacterium humi]SEB51830.1 hypothetical protein SAMN04489806_0950 [Microbacterium humi]